MVDDGYKKFVERLESVCEKYADKTAITYMRNDGSIINYSFSEILKHIQAAKEDFSKIGLKPGDRVAIISPHSPFAIIAAISLAYSNLTSVLIDASLPTEEIIRLLEHSDVRAVFTTSIICEMIDEKIVQNIPVFDLSNELTDYKVFFSSTEKATSHPTIDPDTGVLVILFSSGTTATVKGVEITFSATLPALDMCIKTTAITENSYFLHILPIFHIAGYNSFWQFLFCGSNIGIVEDFDASKLQTALNIYQPTHFLIVPRAFEIIEQKIRNEIKRKGIATKVIFSILYSLCGFSYKTFGINLGKSLLSFIRCKVFGNKILALGTGSSICMKSTSEFFLNIGVSCWANYYASTETSTPTTVCGVFDRYPVGTVGKVDRFDGINIKIHDPDENGIGEIRVKTILIMKGYFRDPELTAAAFDENGYFKTGDLGYIDKKKYLHVTGRIKEAIMLHTGKKVAPTDVDSFYGSIMSDFVFASCGVPNKNGTYDEIHLFIEKGELSTDEQNELRNRVMELSGQTSTLYQLAGLHFIDEIPMTSIKKVKRFQLKDMALTEYNKS